MPSYDPGLRRRVRREGRERGCWVYVAAEELRKAGYDPDAPPGYYRAWGSRRGGVLLRFYRER